MAAGGRVPHPRGPQSRVRVLRNRSGVDPDGAERHPQAGACQVPHANAPRGHQLFAHQFRFAQGKHHME